MLIERRSGSGCTRVLIDTSPDLREQLLDAEVDWIDGVLYTHEHADHTHGIDDLRALFMHKRRRLDAYLDDATSRVLYHKFGYCFVTPPGSNYPPIMNEHRIRPGEPVTIHGEGGPITAMPFLQDHGDIPSLGFRISGVAYSADLVDLPAESLSHLEGLDVWVVDALRYRPHVSHFSVDDALRWIGRLGPRRAILTNLHSDLDFDELRSKVPGNVEPAYDGLRFEVP
jgi:phosphoribosyl 1,2-cyclic phosphate phosphodiesterase